MIPLLLWFSGSFAQSAEYVAGEVPDVNFGAPFVLAHDEAPSMWSYTATGADRREWVLETGVRYATPALEYAAPLHGDTPARLGSEMFDSKQSTCRCAGSLW
jgi:hypothetical protein